MSTSHYHTASGRPLRVSPAWVGAAGHRTAEEHLLPVHEAVWIWSVRRYARVSLWGLPVGAALYGWATLGVAEPTRPLLGLAAGWCCVVAMIGLGGLLAASRTGRPALAGLLVGLAGLIALLPLAALPSGTVPDGSVLSAAQLHTASHVAAAVLGAGLLLLGWAVFRCRLVNPADGVLLMLAAVSVGAGSFAPRPLATVGALLLLAAGMGLAWTGARLIPAA